MPPLRRLLPPVLSAVLALAVAVPVTWAVATSQASAPGPAPVPTGPYNRQELRAELLAQLPGRDTDGAVPLEVRSSIEAAVGFPPGRYRLHLICGLLRRQGEPEEMSFLLDAVDHTWQIDLPCPSTPLTMADQLDFTGAPAGGLAVMPDFIDRRPASYQPRLTALPPGSYLVQASCQLTAPQESVPDPVRYRVDLRWPAGPSLIGSTLHCDGTVGTVHPLLPVSEYDAFFMEFGFIFEPVREARGDQYYAIEESSPVVVVSFSRQ